MKRLMLLALMLAGCVSVTAAPGATFPLTFSGSGSLTTPNFGLSAGKYAVDWDVQGTCLFGGFMGPNAVLAIVKSLHSEHQSGTDFATVPAGESYAFHVAADGCNWSLSVHPA